MISSRVRLAWAGDWGALWRSAAGSGTYNPPATSRIDTPKDQVRNVEALVSDGLLARAVARVRRTTSFAVGGHVYDALVTLFPPGTLPPPALVPTAADDEARGALLAQAHKPLGRWPSRASPGPNGSRFEHWGTVTLDSVSWNAAAQVIDAFAYGECSTDFLRANLGARIFALRKPNGKLRPLACGSVLRRLAARACCAAFHEEIRLGVGRHQFAVGRAAGCEHVHKSGSKK